MARSLTSTGVYISACAKMPAARPLSMDATSKACRSGLGPAKISAREMPRRAPGSWQRVPAPNRTHRSCLIHEGCSSDPSCPDDNPSKSFPEDFDLSDRRPEPTRKRRCSSAGSPSGPLLRSLRRSRPARTPPPERFHAPECAGTNRPQQGAWSPTRSVPRRAPTA